MQYNEIAKYLYKNKEIMAKFSHYATGNLYYNVELEDGTYQFPIATVDNIPDECGEHGEHTLKMSADLGTTSFDAEIKASMLNRWINKAIDSQTFIKIK